MVRGRWVAAALMLALTGCDVGEPASGRGPASPGEDRAPIIGPSELPGAGADAPAPGPGSPAPGRDTRAPHRTPGAPTPGFRSTGQGVCDEAGAGEALRVSTADPAGTGILEQWDACVRTDTTPAYTWLHNRTRAVWILPTAPWDIVQEHRPARTRLETVRSGVFHRAAEELGKPSNASAFIHPGESLWIAADPGTVRWHVDLPLTVAWAGAGAIVHRLDDHGQQLLTQAVAGRDTGPSVTVLCILALYDHARGRTDLHRADLGEVLRDGFEQVLADEDCAEAAGETTVGRRGRTISVLEDVLEVIPASEATLEEAGDDLEPYQALQGMITLEPLEAR